MKPLISIITINYNNVTGLKQTIKSVVEQTYDNIEFIVIDGKSNDGSIEFLQSNKKKIDKLLIEPDNGIYDAMNKGISRCTGDFCLFLNSGDYFISADSLNKMVYYINNKHAVYFSIAKIYNEKISWYMPPKNVIIKKWLKNHSPNHQTILFPKKFYTEHKYDSFYKIVGDVDYIERAKSMFPFYFVPEYTIIFYLGGLSNSISDIKLMKRQILESLIVHLKYYPHKIVYLFYVPFKFITKYFISKLVRHKYDQFLKAISKFK